MLLYLESGFVNMSDLFADKLMKLAEEIVEKENEAQVCAIRIDCSDPKSIKEAFEAVNSLGAVEALVCFSLPCLALPFRKLTFCHLAGFNFGI
jgi:hypothetical protein